MQTKPKSNSVITHQLDAARGAITFHVKGAGSVTLTLSHVHDDNRHQAMLHGFIQRISDAAAIGRDEETGQPASPAQKLDAMRRLVEHYESGTSEWSRVAEAGPKGGILFKALCRMYAGKSTPEQVREFLDKRTKAEQAALRADAKVKAIIDAIQAEEGAKANVNTDELLGQLAA